MSARPVQEVEQRPRARGGIQIPVFLLVGVLEKGIGLQGLVMVFLIVPLELMWRIVCR